MVADSTVADSLGCQDHLAWMEIAVLSVALDLTKSLAADPAAFLLPLKHYQARPFVPAAASYSESQLVVVAVAAAFDRLASFFLLVAFPQAMGKILTLQGSLA